MQAIDGILQGDELLTQMQKLQSEFSIRYNNIEIEQEHARPPIEMIEENDESELPGMISDTSSHHGQSNHDSISSGGGSISWEQSLTHQDPLFRPMSTLSQRSIAVKDEPKPSNVSNAEDPIIIDDDESEDSSFMVRDQS